MAKSALGKDPSVKGGKTPRPKTRRARGGVWVDPEGYRVDGYGRRLPGQKEPYEKPKAPKPSKPATPAAPAAPPTDPYTQQVETPWEQQTPEQRDVEIDESVGGLMRGIVGQAQPFDPGSSQQMADQAYQNVLAQFEADNAQAFQQQEAAFYQRAAEQGMDPTSKAYGALYKQEVTDRQDRARQQAMRTALDTRQAVQQQDFTQQYQRFLAPGEQFGQFAPTWGQGQKTRADMAQLQAQLGSAMDIAKLQERGALQRAQIQAKGGGGGGGGAAAPTLYDRWRTEQISGGYPPTPNANIGGNITVGATSGAGGSFTNRLQNQPKKQA